MSGVDAAAGFAYQHAQAVHRVLDLAEDSALGFVRVEATNDVVDIETHTVDGRLRSVEQFKRRGLLYTWGKGELVAELARWSKLGSSYADTSYAFVTDGRLGPTGRGVLDALKAAHAGYPDKLAALAQTQGVALDFDVCRRATIVADTPGFDTLINSAGIRAAGLLPNVSGEVESEERSVGVVLEILRIVVGRSGKANPDARRIHRTEVIELLSDRHEYVPTATWSNELKRGFTTATQRSSQQGIGLMCLADTPTGTSDLPDQTVPAQLIALADAGQVPLVHGPTGSGKSTALSRAQHAAAQDGRIVIVVDAENYVPNRLGSLIARGINAPEFAGAYSATGLEALKDPTVTVMIDGVSEIAREAREALTDELRKLLATDEHAGLVLAGRDGTVLRSVLHRHAPSTRVRVEPLNRQRRIELLSDITKYAASTRTVNELVAQVERALGGAADNPQLFVVGVTLLLRGQEFTNPAAMYQSYVRDTAERNGYPRVTLFEAGLGIAFASLARDGRRYCDSIEWSQELQRATTTLEEFGEDVTPRELRLFGFESGLIVQSTADTVRALHDSFADYFAAVAYRRKLSTPPSTATSDDRARLEFYAELDGLSLDVANVAARDVPFMVPKLSLREKDTLDHTDWYAATRGFLDQLWPADQAPPHVAYWMSAGRLMVTAAGMVEGWLGECSINDVGTAGFMFHAERGPLSVAVRIWEQHLRTTLGNRRRNPAPVPTTDDETVTVLERYSVSLEQSVQELIEQAAPTRHKIDLANTVGATHIQFFLPESRHAESQRDRPLKFRYIEDPTSPTVLRHGDAIADAEWTGRGRVDSFIMTDARTTAGTFVIRAINDLAGMHWL
ncbi:hypothetical protein J2W56_006303 [Nocardia kruczakiae]|uniref:AAA+ ATPase domain-containing protein n=1 Tax=Nocardia kruczakiae TaxID=261477 RepID=A0ABU1XPQ4_9NOCA|nr:ATP-binding protein [Nocardia kruczakiae]MDR7172538.1 hypothetical protein [Nocardia kruczakiae]